MTVENYLVASKRDLTELITQPPIQASSHEEAARDWTAMRYGDVPNPPKEVDLIVVKEGELHGFVLELSIDTSLSMEKL